MLDETQFSTKCFKRENILPLKCAIIGSSINFLFKFLAVQLFFDYEHPRRVRLTSSIEARINESIVKTVATH